MILECHFLKTPNVSGMYNVYTHAHVHCILLSCHDDSVGMLT